MCTHFQIILFHCPASHLNPSSPQGFIDELTGGINLEACSVYEQVSVQQMSAVAAD